MTRRLAASAVAAVALIACAGGEEPTARATAPGCKPAVVVYLDAGVSEARQRRVGLVLNDRPEVESTAFHSPAEAFREFKRLYRGQPEIIEDRTVDDFPGFYNVTLTGQNAFDTFEASLVGAIGIDKLVPGGCEQTQGPTP
ncbi:MAG: permease-like cell division protein FtsX [Actinomycetota bacterium]